MLRPDTPRMGIDRQRRAEVRGNEVSGQGMVAVANRHSCADNKIWRKNGMDEERKALMVFGIIVVFAAILIATALVMNLMVG